MRTFLVLILVVLTLTFFGQDTIYFNRIGDEVNSIELAQKYDVIIRDSTDINKVLSRTYLISGQIISEGYYKPYSKKIKQEKWKEWYELGQLRTEKNYKNGIVNGELLTYWENGQTKRRDFYEDGVLKNGKVWNEKGRKVKYYDYIISPEFQGGISNLYKYLQSNVRYPQASKSSGIEGRVVVNFVVEKDGTISNARVVVSVNNELDAEALRVVNKMPKWIPGLIDGKIVRVGFTLPIKFSLN